MLHWTEGKCRQTAGKGQRQKMKSKQRWIGGKTDEQGNDLIYSIIRN